VWERRCDKITSARINTDDQVRADRVWRRVLLERRPPRLLSRPIDAQSFLGGLQLRVTLLRPVWIRARDDEVE